MSVLLPATIDEDQKALARIVAGLFAMLGLSAGVGPRLIARSLYRSVCLVLRPAESAVRRLIFVLSLGIRTGNARVRPMPSGIAGKGATMARPCFRLFDPRLRLGGKARVARAAPRISFFGEGDVRTVTLGGALPRKPEVDDEINAAALLRRLESIKSALDDLPRQARRLKRALLRRSRSPRLKMQGVLRPGYPPGHRIRRRHEIDDILRRCHQRARETLPPDTS